MKRTEKHQLKDELHEIFLNNPNALVIGFAGLKVNDDAQLRRKLEAANCSYKVVKNTIARKAAEGTPMEAVADHFTGTTAVAYSPNDAVGLAKVFRDFSKDNKSFKFKAILVEGHMYPGDQLEKVASMPTKEEAISQLLFLLNHPVTSLARVLQASMRDLAVVLNEIKK